MALFNDYLNSLSPVFSQDPEGYDAIQITSACYAVVTDNVLTIYETNQETTYPLGNYTLSSLVTALTNNGITASLSPSAVGTVSANALLDAEGVAPITLQSFSSDNFLLFKPQAAMVENAQSAIAESITIYNIRSATGEWLNYWGWFLQVPRYENEPDSLYAERIIGLRFGHNVNNIALENFFAKMGYDTNIVDTGPGQFQALILNPLSPPSGFVYSLAQIEETLQVIKAAGIQASIIGATYIYGTSQMGVSAGGGYDATYLTTVSFTLSDNNTALTMSTQ